MTHDERVDKNKVEPGWVDEVLHFWFDELAEADWFGKVAALDARICERFLALHERLSAPHHAKPVTPRMALATVIVLDQFPRNMFRDDTRAYATDALARQVSMAAIAAGFDTHMPVAQRMFLYLPLEHSETVEDQSLAVRLIGALGHDEWTQYAVAHQKIIQRFGRFPHRNAVLGRVSSAEELALLQQPMGSF